MNDADLQEAIHRSRNTYGVEKELQEALKQSQRSYEQEKAIQRRTKELTPQAAAAIERSATQQQKTPRTHQAAAALRRSLLLTEQPDVTRKAREIDELLKVQKSLKEISLHKHVPTPPRRVVVPEQHHTQTDNERHMHELLCQMLDLTLFFHPRERNGHCLYACFEEFANVKTLRQKVIEQFGVDVKFNRIEDDVNLDLLKENVRCTHPGGFLKEEANFDEMGSEVELLALVRALKINVVTVTFTAGNRLHFNIYLSRYVDGTQRIHEVHTSDAEDVKKWLYDRFGNVLVIGLVDHHWSLFELPTFC